MVSENSSILSVFSNYHITLDKNWLDGCITWAKNEKLPPNYRLKDLQFQIYQQWLSVDLRQFNIPILPPNISKQIKYTLPNVYFLQLMKIVDISKPKLWQLQKIRNNNVTLAKTWNEDNEYGKRVLLMTLTDGVQEIEAMEYRPVKGLNVNLKPGCKLRLKGPVIVRRGRVMVEEKHIVVLDGSVEELLVENAMENVLARALNLKENPNPTTIDEKLFVVGEEEPKIPSTTVSRPQNPSQSRNNSNCNEILKKTVQNRPNLSLPNTSLAALEENNEIFDFVDDDFFSDFVLDAHLDEVEKQMLENNITIAKLKQYIQENKTGTYKIHGKFASIVEKLTFDENKYKFVIKIIDNNNDELNVRVASDIIEDIIGYSPAGIRELKTVVSGNDSNATRIVFKAIGNLKTKLQELDNLLDIKINNGDEYAEIVKIN